MENFPEQYQFQREYYPQFLISKVFINGLINFNSSSAWQNYLKLINALDEQKEIQLRILNKKPTEPNPPIAPPVPIPPKALISSPVTYLKQTQQITLIFSSLLALFFSLLFSSFISLFLGIFGIIITVILAICLIIIVIILINYSDCYSRYKLEYLAYLQSVSRYDLLLSEYQRNLSQYQRQIQEYQQTYIQIERHIKKEKEIINFQISQLTTRISRNYNQQLKDFHQLANKGKKHLFSLSAEEQKKITVGVAEENFYQLFNTAFSNWIEELNQNLTDNIFYQMGWNQQKFRAFSEQNQPLDYFPDIFLQFHDYLLDIEIDEPYIFNTLKPHHEKEGKDNYRNQLFLKYGFFVIRFSEYQIVTYPEACINTIAEFCLFICPPHLLLQLNQIKIFLPFPKHNNLPPIDKTWNRLEATTMARNQVRKSYLANK